MYVLNIAHYFAQLLKLIYGIKLVFVFKFISSFWVAKIICNNSINNNININNSINKIVSLKKIPMKIHFHHVLYHYICEQK